MREYSYEKAILKNMERRNENLYFNASLALILGPCALAMMLILSLMAYNIIILFSLIMTASIVITGIGIKNIYNSNKEDFKYFHDVDEIDQRLHLLTKEHESYHEKWVVGKWWENDTR